MAALWTAAPLRPKKRDDFRKKRTRQWKATFTCTHCQKRGADFAWNWVHARMQDVVFHAKCFKDGGYKQCSLCHKMGTRQNMYYGVGGNDTHRTAWAHFPCAGGTMPTYRLLRKRRTIGGIFL